MLSCREKLHLLMHCWTKIPHHSPSFKCALGSALKIVKSAFGFVTNSCYKWSESWMYFLQVALQVLLKPTKIFSKIVFKHF